MQTERDSRDLTSSEICDPNVTQVPEQRGETQTFVLFERLKRRGMFSCLCTNSPNPRQETRRPDFPRFLWRKTERGGKKGEKKIRRKQWGKTSVWSVGAWDTFEHSITGEIPSYSPLMCVSDKQRAEWSWMMRRVGYLLCYLILHTSTATGSFAKWDFIDEIDFKMRRIIREPHGLWSASNWPPPSPATTVSAAAVKTVSQYNIPRIWIALLVVLLLILWYSCNKVIQSISSLW